MDKSKEDSLKLKTEIKSEGLIREDSSFLLKKKRKWVSYFGFLIIILAGISTGYFLSQQQSVKQTETKFIQTEKAVGSKDTKIFRDSAEGVLEKGGINGEGTHKLIRPGGESQTVYLTSSVVDLNQFVGKKVKVWGETLAAEKAGWFMDVGRLELME